MYYSVCYKKGISSRKVPIVLMNKYSLDFNFLISHNKILRYVSSQILQVYTYTIQAPESGWDQQPVPSNRCVNQSCQAECVIDKLLIALQLSTVHLPFSVVTQ